MRICTVTRLPPAFAAAALQVGQSGGVGVVPVHARPARIRGMHDPISAPKKTHAAGAAFVSRGDDSGTDKKVPAHRKSAGVDPKGPHKLAIGPDMGQTLTVAGEKRACILSGRAAYASYAAKTGLGVMVEGGKALLDLYGVSAINPKRSPGIDYEGATAFSDWMTSSDGQKAIGDMLIALPILVVFTISAVQGGDPRVCETARSPGAGPVRLRSPLCSKRASACSSPATTGR